MAAGPLLQSTQESMASLRCRLQIEGVHLWNDEHLQELCTKNSFGAVMNEFATNMNHRAPLA